MQDCILRCSFSTSIFSDEGKRKVLLCLFVTKQNISFSKGNGLLTTNGTEGGTKGNTEIVETQRGHSEEDYRMKRPVKERRILVVGHMTKVPQLSDEKRDFILLLFVSNRLHQRNHDFRKEVTSVMQRRRVQRLLNETT